MHTNTILIVKMTYFNSFHSLFYLYLPLSVSLLNNFRLSTDIIVKLILCNFFGYPAPCRSRSSGKSWRHYCMLVVGIKKFCQYFMCMQKSIYLKNIIEGSDRSKG